MPALLTRISIRPSLSTTLRAISRVCVWSLTSHRCPTARTPLASNSATVRTIPSSFTSAITSVAPSCAKRSAAALPIPDAPPVMIATLSFNRMFVVLDSLGETRWPEPGARVLSSAPGRPVAQRDKSLVDRPVDLDLPTGLGLGALGQTAAPRYAYPLGARCRTRCLDMGDELPDLAPEIIGRAQERRIDHQKEEAAVGHLLCDHLAASQDCQNLDDERKPVAAMPAPGQERTLERHRRIGRRMTLGIDRRSWIQRLLQLAAQKDVAPGRHARAEVDDQRLGVAGESEGHRVGAENPVDSPGGGDAGLRAGRVEGDETRTRRPLDVIGQTAAEPSVADSHH